MLLIAMGARDVGTYQSIIFFFFFFIFFHSCFLLSTLAAEHYFSGMGCAQRSSELAFKWHEKAAEKGSTHSQYFVGEAYSNGKGVKKKIKRALKWFLIAAEHGHASAQVCLLLVIFFLIFIIQVFNTLSIL